MCSIFFNFHIYHYNLHAAGIFVQPTITGGLGQIGNASASMSPMLERAERMQQSMSLGNIVLHFLPTLT